MSHQKQREPVTQEQLSELLGARGNTDPVPILKHKAENSVKRQLKEVAVRGCHESVRALAECSEGKLLSVVWRCRVHSKAIDACMNAFANDEALKDEMRRRHGLKFPGAIKGYRQSSNIASEGEDAPL